MDRGAWWATVHRVAELDMTGTTQHGHTHTMYTVYGLYYIAYIQFILYIVHIVYIIYTYSIQSKRHIVYMIYRLYCKQYNIYYVKIKHTKTCFIYVYICIQCIYRRRQWQSTPVVLPGKSHGWRSLVGCCPWGRIESDTTERLHFHFSLFMHWRRKWQPTPVFLPGESQGGRSLVGCRLWGRHRVGHD